MSKYSSPVSKRDLLGKANKSQQQQSNGLSMQGKRETKEYLLENGPIRATRMVIASSDISTKTEAHPLNPRNQKALNAEAVSSTLESIREVGIDTDCLGIWSSDNTKILIIEGSVRRYCALETNRDYPVWVLPANSATSKDIRRLVADASDKKPHSLRERGTAYWQELVELEHTPETMTVDEMAAVLGVGRETVRKCMQAYKLDAALLEIIPDYEGVPVSFYGKLAKAEKELNKHMVDLGDFTKKVMSQMNVGDLSVREAQDHVLAIIEKEIVSLSGGSAKRSWTTTELATYSSKNKYSRKSVSPDGRTVKFELSRADSSLIEAIEGLIKQRS